MSKPVEAKANPAGGYDLLTERSSGEAVRILTGRTESSLEFWEDLAAEARFVIPFLKLRLKEDAADDAQ